ncbi:hypothetical protein PF005_g5505 [Phytophthora fragariae]|uniref:Uncharacterized protein n=1 Tax=Phytophthora fragariae TaxID=53985 RepID=A0A6A3FE28_9STRA|nr:hypothetical protein PF003_g9624 [Phytophthora fragariae]KAE8944294.1 hypothetical protein PF009_g6030 [Phytophthora fragariae]KAE9022779.1 hypothetical protein PF011_g4298 [Phytophthora fragariae]KAE9129693.1 hypothetical protein PF007_g4796 [Phytophthora fragariae]KAE9151468.1 hypothetical protein PF006_g4247 [Phytophthora fragariae]
MTFGTSALVAVFIAVFRPHMSLCSPLLVATGRGLSLLILPCQVARVLILTDTFFITVGTTTHTSSRHLRSP